MTKEQSKLLTADELAQVVGVSSQTISEWARQGRIPAVTITPKTRRFDLIEVMRALRKSTSQERHDD